MTLYSANVLDFAKPVPSKKRKEIEAAPAEEPLVKEKKPRSEKQIAAFAKAKVSEEGLGAKRLTFSRKPEKERRQRLRLQRMLNLRLLRLLLMQMPRRRQKSWQKRKQQRKRDD